MNNLFTHADDKQLHRFFVALINHCEVEIDQMRNGFQMELRRIKNPDEQAAYAGDYTVENCWKAFASDDFISVVSQMSDLCGAQIGAVPLLLDTPIRGGPTISTS